MMTFNDYQSQASVTEISLNKFAENFPDLPEEVMKIVGLSYNGLGLGEAGEVQGKIKKIIRDCGGKITHEHIDQISGELGDILWYISSTCTRLGISMDAVAMDNIRKLHRRKAEGTLEGSGDDR